MKSVGNKVIVSLEREVDDVIKTKSGQEFFVDTGFENYAYAKRDGVVVATNEELEKKGVKSGRRIYIHHRATHDSNVREGYVSLKILENEKLYSCQFPSQVFLIEDENGELQVQGEWLFGKQVKREPPKSDSGIFLSAFEEVLYGRVVLTHVNEEAAANGLKVGDEVLFEKGVGYEMDVEGEKLTRLQNRYVNAKVVDGQMIPMEKRVIAKAIEEEILYMNQPTTRCLVVASGLEGVEEGDVLHYIKKNFQKFDFEGEEYLALWNSHILCKDE